jgi:hypothetical protein
MKAMKADNPAAFPNFAHDYGPLQAGMTLRDYFAGQALPALIAGIYADPEGRELNADMLRLVAVKAAYAMADAMLAARESGQ